MGEQAQEGAWVTTGGHRHTHRLMSFACVPGLTKTKPLTVTRSKGHRAGDQKCSINVCTCHPQAERNGPWNREVGDKGPGSRWGAQLTAQPRDYHLLTQSPHIKQEPPALSSHGR